jgi:hypothetical protein
MVWANHFTLTPTDTPPKSLSGVSFFDLAGDDWPSFHVNSDSHKYLLAAPVYNLASSATNTDIPTVSMISNTTAEHDYLFNWTISLTVPGMGCTGSTTITLNESHTDPNASTSSTVALGTITIARSGNGNVGLVASGSTNILAKSGTSVQYSITSYTPGPGCTKGPTYQVTPTLVQLW